MARRKKSTKRRKAIPKPSITGLASGLIVANALNAGYPFHKPEDWGVSPITGHHYKDTVLQNAMDGDFADAFKRLSHNATELVTTKGGRSHLGKAIGIALVGSAAKKFIGNPKLGFSKFYFTI